MGPQHFSGEGEMKVQPYVSSEDGEIFDVKFCTNEIIFEIIELERKEIEDLLQDIKDQLDLLEEAYKKEV